jgi:MFS family permease
VGALVSTAFLPGYIRDNLALFRIGAMSIGTAEGALIGLLASGRNSIAAGWTGGVLGLGAGAAAGVWLDYKAPNYGRVAVIQSGAVVGALAGALAVPAFKEEGASLAYYEPLGILAGMNLGLGAGLALAYLPPQEQYGPSWKRALLVDLAGAAGAFAGVVGATITKCVAERSAGGNDTCSFAPSQRNARFALVGGAAGLVAGWLLTRNLDKGENLPSERHALRLLPLPTAIAVENAAGFTTVVPGLAAQGRF